MDMNPVTDRRPCMAERLDRANAMAYETNGTLRRIWESLNPAEAGKPESVPDDPKGMSDAVDILVQRQEINLKIASAIAAMLFG